MKEYNRKTRVWEEVSTQQVGNLKKTDKCRGYPAHDYRLALPDFYYRYVDTDLPEEVIQQWYESEDRLYEYKNREKIFQESLGVKINSYPDKYPTRYYRCVNCGKKHWNG